MPQYLPLVAMLIGALLVVSPLGLWMHRRLAPTTISLIGKAALAGLVVHTIAMLATGQHVRDMNTEIRPKLQELKARTTVLVQEVQREKADLAALGARPAERGSPAEMTWIEKSAKFDAATTATSKAIAQLALEQADLQRANQALSVARETSEMRAMGVAILTMLGLFGVGYYRNLRREKVLH